MERWEMPLRRVVGVLVAVVCVPLLLLDLYVLLYWLSALAGPGDVPCDPAVDGWGVCWRPEQRWWWIATAALTLAGAGCAVMSLRGFRRPGRWWPWLLGSMALLLAGAWAGSGIA